MADSRLTNHFWAEIPVDQWDKPFLAPHDLHNNSGSGYTPHQAFVTAVYAVAGKNAHPLAPVVRVTSVSASHVTLVVSPPTLREMLIKKLPVTSLLISVYARYIPSFEVGRDTVADTVMGRALLLGLPVSLLPPLS